MHDPARGTPKFDQSVTDTPTHFFFKSWQNKDELQQTSLFINIGPYMRNTEQKKHRVKKTNVFSKETVKCFQITLILPSLIVFLTR